MPEIATATVAPAAIEAVLPLRVVEPTWTRVVLAPLAVVPRLWTETVKLTAEPTAGLAGLEVTPVISRSGPGAWETWSWVEAVKVLLVSFCSKTVLSGSTVAATA